MTSPTDKTGATGAEHSCFRVCERGWTLVLVPVGGHARFPNSGEVGRWTPQPRFIDGIGKGIACLAKRFWKAPRLF